MFIRFHERIARPGVGYMGLDNYRNNVRFLIEPVAALFKNTNPNTLSWIGLIIAFVAGVTLFYSTYHPTLLLVGAAIVILSGYFDALDGMVAKKYGKCSKKGDYIDHVFDRYADAFMIGGIAVSGWVSPVWGMLALVGTLLTSYMGTQAQAIGAPRLYAGLLGRADRVVMLTAFPIAQYLLCTFAPDYAILHIGAIEIGTLTLGSLTTGPIVFGPFDVSLIQLMIAYFAIVGNATAIQRGIITWRNMSNDEETFGVIKPADTEDKAENANVGKGE